MRATSPGFALHTPNLSARDRYFNSHALNWLLGPHRTYSPIVIATTSTQRTTWRATTNSKRATVT
jgi:hypothetical protein